MIAREVLPSRLRPGWRMAIALPVVIAFAIGAAERVGAALSAFRAKAGAAAAVILAREVQTIVAWPADGGSPSLAGCGHGGALVAAVAFGAGLAIICILIGLAIARGRSWRQILSGEDDDGDDGDGGDEDELDLPFGGFDRIAVIAVPRHDAPGAPEPPVKDTN